MCLASVCLLPTHLLEEPSDRGGVSHAESDEFPCTSEERREEKIGEKSEPWSLDDEGWDCRMATLCGSSSTPEDSSAGSE